MVEKITFSQDGQKPVEFYVLEQTMIGGCQYILVTDQEEGDGDALILKDVSNPEEEEGLYRIVEDETELDAVAAVFANILEDIDLLE